MAQLQAKEEVKLEMVPYSGIDIGEGSIKTTEGVIRVPKSKLKKQKKEVQEKQPPQEPKNNFLQHIPPRLNPEAVKVVFDTALGTVSGTYFPVVEAGEFVVLGLTDQSFIPKSYKENKDLRLNISCEKVKATVLFTGCRFKDEDTNREYIVLMKV